MRKEGEQMKERRASSQQQQRHETPLGRVQSAASLSRAGQELGQKGRIHGSVQVPASRGS